MEERIRALEDTLRAVNERLAKIEKLAYGEEEEPAQRSSAGSRAQTSSDEPPKFVPPKKDSAIGMSKLLAIVAVVCFVLAASFIVKLAVETGWLTPFRQWAMVVFLGGALGVAGRYLPMVDKTYRSYLSAAGLVVLYIGAYSSSLYFGIVSEDVSIVFGMVVSVVGLTMFQYHRSELFPAVSVVGTYLSVLLMQHQSMGMNFQAGFFVVWALVFSWFSTHFQSRMVNLLATYHGLGVLAYLNMEIKDGEQVIVALVLLTLQFLIFTWGVAAYTMKNKVALTKQETWSYFPALCFYYGIMYFFIHAMNPVLAPWIGLGIAVGFVMTFESVKKKLQTMNVEASQTMVYSFLALVIFQAGYLQLLPGSAKPWLLPLFIIMNYVSEQKKDFPKIGHAFRVLGIAIGAIEFGDILWKLVDSHDPMTPLVAFITLGLGIFYYLNLGKLVQAKEKSYLGMVHILGVLALYRIAYDYGSLMVSIAWALYAAFILGLGYYKKDRNLVTSSLVVLFFASGKALIYDGSGAPSSVRIGSLIFTGVLLFGTGVLFRKMQDWQK